jgi:galactose oxidase-like protein
MHLMYRSALLIGLLVLAGCGSGSATTSPSTSSSPPQGSTSPGSPSAGARSSAAAGYDEASSQVLVFGGEGPPTTNAAFDYLGDTWVWGGRSWTHQDGKGPSPRFGATMAYDAARRQLVLFGGLPVGDLSGETWTWDGRAWTQRHPAASPPSRQFAGMVYDAARRVVVLFGGQTVSPTTPILSDTWTWDGATWTPQHPARSPASRVSFAITYDAARERVVLFGGDSGQGQQFSGGYGDTWTWDGANWSSAPTGTSPPRRAWAAMAYDAAVGKSVLFGGVSGPQATLMNDTWTWDGAHWQQQPLAHSPPARQGATMVYDAARRVVVQYGGRGGSGSYLADTWTWDGVSWSAR